ncbi:MAG: PQQ-binding-like beta-propeller repeat protein, partial [Holophagales bacterium]|nr:PQQ-binding-like beta-propeller repeat protein [Holophagales bacterium]
RAALVGYTNAGKSSLLRALSGSELFVEDRLFATLDSATRKVELGSGYSSPVVGGGRAITMFAAGEHDVMAAYATGSGKELWRYRIGDTYAGHDGSHDGPISTPMLSGDRVFGLGAWGKLFALDAATGEELWSTHLKDDYSAEKPHYGFSTSPVLADGMLVVQIGAGEGKWIAGFEAETGKLAWTHGDGKVDYQSPIVAELGGERQVVAATAEKVVGIDPASGEALWTYEHGGDGAAMGGASLVPQPAGANRLFLVNKSDGSTMVEVTKDGEGWSAKELWANNSIRSTYVQPVYHDGFLYGIAGRILTAVNAETGERAWRSREPGDGFPTLVGDHLVIITKPGGLHVVKASPEAYEEVAGLELFDDHSWSAVAYAEGSLFARSMGHLARIDPVLGEGDTESGDSWLADTAFGAFLDEVAAAENKPTVVQAFL